MTKSPSYVSIKFQLFNIILSTIIIGTAIIRLTKTFHHIDPKPPIQSMSPALIASFGGRPTPIHVGFLISDFPVFDVIQGHCEVKGLVWFQFDPTMFSLKTINQFVFDRGEILEKSEPFTKIVGHEIFVRYEIRVKFALSLQYSYFPYDDHVLYFMLTHNTLSPYEAQFVSRPDDFIVLRDLEPMGWKLVSKNAQSGYIESELNEREHTNKVFKPAVLFSLSFFKKSLRHSLAILLPLLLIFFLTLGAFSIDYMKYPESVISLPIGSITALLAYQFVIQSISPSVGYFMVSDLMFFTILAAIFFVFFLCIFVAQLSAFTKKIAIVLLHAFVDISFIYILVFA